ncbi:MAG: tyrosine-type recombinase/integrase [Chloroflexi bacterium]|nr:tyrosine-type recombinase/integrase [Chloroflexota bacterium]
MSDLSVIVENALALQTPPAAERHPAVVYLAALASPQSVRTLRAALNRLADLLLPALAESLPPETRRERYRLIQWEALRYAHTQALRARLLESGAPATANKTLAALRGVLGAAYEMGLMNGEDYQRAVRVKNVRSTTLPKGRDLKLGEIAALAAACKADPSPAGRRDAALLGVLYTCGLRRAEVAALDVADYQPESGQLRVLQGKGRKARTVYVSGGAQAALAAWLHVRGTQPGALFTPVLKSGDLRLCPMTAQAIYYRLKTRAHQAGVRAFSPHDLRRTFVGDLLERGADIATVAKLAGHADVQTTARYDRRAEDSKRKASELLHFPF